MVIDAFEPILAAPIDAAAKLLSTSPDVHEASRGVDGAWP
jgi:hypothetical protein